MYAANELVSRRRVVVLVSMPRVLLLWDVLSYHQIHKICHHFITGSNIHDIGRNYCNINQVNYRKISRHLLSPLQLMSTYHMNTIWIPSIWSTRLLWLLRSLYCCTSIYCRYWFVPQVNRSRSFSYILYPAIVYSSYHSKHIYHRRCSSLNRDQTWLSYKHQISMYLLPSPFT